MNFFIITLLFAWATLAIGQTPTFEKTQKVSIIFVGPSKGLSESSFGHLALRLSPEETPGLLDVVVEFVADMPTNEKASKKYLKGIGLGSAYPVAAKIRPFYEFKKIKTIEEDRPLRVLELKLTKEETKSVAEFIADFRNKVVPEDYAFFTKNCSFFSALAIEAATGKDLGIKSLPWQIPKKILKVGLVDKEEVFESASTERMRYAQRSIDRDKINEAFPSAVWTGSFVSMLGEYRFVFRQSSYLKLLWVLQSDTASPQVKKRTQALIRYLLSHETDAIQFVLRNLFENPEKKTVIELETVQYSNPKLELKHEFIIKDQRLSLEAKWNAVDDDVYGHQSVKSFKKTYPLQQIGYDENTRSLSFEGVHVGRFVESKRDDLVLTQVLDYGFAVDRSRQTLTSFLYVDHSEKIKTPKYTFEDLKNNGIIGLNNATDFKGELGSCYALVLLQKALVERAIFLPQLPKNGALDKLSTLSAIYDGDYAFIPGHRNIQEFTSSIDKTALKEFVRVKQKALEKSSFQQVLENFRYREEMNTESMKDLKALLSEGVSVPIIIGALKKGKNKLADTAGHVILLFDIQEIGKNTHRLTAYDPNTGLSTLYTIDQEYKLHFPFYDKKFDYKGMIDHLPPDLISLDHAVRSREYDYDLIKNLLRTQKTLVIETPLIYRFLK